MHRPPPKSPEAALPHVSAWLVHIFATYAGRYLRSQFHSFRILRAGLPPDVSGRPLVIYLNHAAWWDPLVCLRLSQRWFADLTAFAPIDSAMFEKYRFFKDLGFFGVEQNSARGARQFLRTSRAILDSWRTVLWLTPQGRFTDVRERPVRLRPGIGALAAWTPDAMFVPLAIEYAFWTEQRPEILVSFGKPIVPIQEWPRTGEEWQHSFAQALQVVQDELANASLRRDSAEWLLLEDGKSGVSPFYDAWRRIRAKFRGEVFSPDHYPGSTR